MLDVIKSVQNNSTLDCKISALNRVSSECINFTDVIAMMLNNSFEFGIFPPLDLQNQGEPEEWPPFVLNNINGLRECGRLQN